MVDIHKIIEEYLNEQADPPVGKPIPVASWRAWTFGDPDSAGKGGMWSTDGGTTWTEDPPSEPEDPADPADPADIAFTTSVSSMRDWLSGEGENPNQGIGDIIENDGNPVGEGEDGVVIPGEGNWGFVDMYLNIKDKVVGLGLPEISQQGNIETPDGGLTHIWNEDPWVVPGLGYPFGPQKLPKEDPTK